MSPAGLRLLLVGLVPPEAGGSIACGVARHVLELAEQASARGYEVAILAPLRPGVPEYRADIRFIDASRSLPTRFLTGGRAAVRRNRPRSAFWAGTAWRDRVSILSWTERIGRAIAEMRPDLVHIHPLSHPAGPGLSELPRGIPVIFTDHGFWQDLRRPGDLDKVREAARLASGIIAVSRHCLERQVRDGVRSEGLREIIYNPVIPAPPRSIRARTEVGRPSVLFVAGVDSLARKGLETLLGAFAENGELRRRAELIVIAEDNARRRAARVMAAAGIAGRVLPLRPCREMAAVYGSADVFALPSRSEAFPLVFLESLSAGTPVVGFAPAVEELREFLGPDAGLPFDAATGTAAGLAEDILQTLGRPLNRGNLAARTAAAFSWEVMFPAFDRFYHEVMKLK